MYVEQWKTLILQAFEAFVVIESLNKLSRPRQALNPQLTMAHLVLQITN